MKSEIKFCGSGPFDLPTAQEARADSGTDAVTLSFRVLITPNQMGVVRIAVLNNQALEFASQIVAAVPRRPT